MADKESPLSDIYTLLGVSQMSPMEGVRTRFYKLTRLIHRELALMPELDRRKQLLHDLKFICIAYDILSDPVTRTDYDLRTMGLRGADVLPMPDEKKGSEMGQRLHLKIGELLNVAGLLEASELEIACDMHKAMPEMQFGSFLVKQGFIEDYQLKAVLFAQKLLRKGLITVVQYQAAMEELESSGVGVSETVVERGYVTQSDLDHLEEEEAEAQAMRTSQPVYTQPALAPREEQVSSHTNLLAQMLPPGAVDARASGNGEKAPPSMLSKLLAGAEEAAQSGTPTSMKDLLKKAGESGVTEISKRKHVETKEEPVIESLEEPFTQDFAASTYVGEAYRDDLMRGGSTDEISRYSDSSEHETFIENDESDVEADKDVASDVAEGEVSIEEVEEKTEHGSVDNPENSSALDEDLKEIPGHIFEDGGLLGGDTSAEESSEGLDAVDSLGDDETEEEARRAAAARASVDVAINIDIDDEENDDDKDDEANITLVDADGTDFSVPGAKKKSAKGDNLRGYSAPPLPGDPLSSESSEDKESTQHDVGQREKPEVTHDRMPAYARIDKSNNLVDLDSTSAKSPTSELDTGAGNPPTKDPSLVTTRDRIPAFRPPLHNTFQLDESAKTAEEAIEGEDISSAVSDVDEAAPNLVISNAVASWKDQLDWSSPEGESGTESVTNTSDREPIDITRNLDLEAVEKEEEGANVDTIESFLGGDSLEDAGELNELGRPLWDVEDDEFILPPKKKKMSATAENMNAAPGDDLEELHGKERKPSGGWQRLKNPFELQVDKGQSGERKRRIQAAAETTGEEEPVTAELFQEESNKTQEQGPSSQETTARPQIDIGLNDGVDDQEVKMSRPDIDIELPKDFETSTRPDIDIELPKSEESEQIGRPDIDIELPKDDDDAELSEVVSELNETIDEVAADLKKEFRSALREAQETTIPPNDQREIEPIVDVQISLEAEDSAEEPKPIIEIELPEAAASEASTNANLDSSTEDGTTGDTKDAGSSGAHSASESAGGRRRRPPSHRHHRKKD